MSTQTPNRSSTSTSIRDQDSDVAEPLYQVKLLSALRSGDPALIHPFLAEIGKDRRKSLEGDLDTGAAALHLAIRCGSVETVSLLLSHRAISPNGIHPPGSGTSALHLAASLGRADVVNLLLEQDGINDTLKDIHGRTCREVAKGKDVVRAIDDSRLFLNASYRSLLRTYILSPPSAHPSQSLLTLLESPRVQFVNLSYLDDDSGTSLLHEAARRKDLRLIELAVRAGADVFVRDRRGKMAYEGAGKDDRVRVFLRQFANHDKTLIQTPLGEPPTLKGYLNKYTNVAKGYGTRWFVLKDGILSYYRHQEDETVASRGSISMKTAILKINTVDRLRFEVHSTPSRGHHSVQKWYMKANHPVEASRWTQAIGKSIDWYKRDLADGDRRRKSVESDSSGLKAALSNTWKRESLSVSPLKRNRNAGGSGATSTSGSYTDLGMRSNVGLNDCENASPDLNQIEPHLRVLDGGDDGDAENNDSSSAESTRRTPPYDSGFELHGNSTAAQMELTSQLLANFVLPPDSPPKTLELKDALKDLFAMVQRMLNEYVQMANEREEWWAKQLEREKERQNVWEESLATVVKEGEALERQLRTQSRKRGSRFFDTSVEGFGTVRQRSSKLNMSRTTSVLEEHPAPERRASDAFQLISTPVTSPAQAVVQEITVVSTPAVADDRDRVMVDNGVDIDLDTDEEDEFFDAIESNTLPNLRIPESLTSPGYSEQFVRKNFDIEPYVGYKSLRTTLELKDQRPSTSLWSVLKHSIGKDLTRISFPVFFNEPTSMLQRMAEDMEFSECLDAAAREEDPHRRIAFVAAFAMSNYSSTIGRIAKPFNPMLSETFEYVRLDKDYRYVSEQVSHHPPISACWAESPYWHYYGEVDAQNKFMGKSFEIRPTGVAHAELLLPEKMGPGYPKAKGKIGAGKVVEHYSWKKVTTNISGFILGSPTIDHYGDMIITNHRTNDQCILTFKPRGWRGKDAYEISGQVMDSSGNVTYEIAGRWNSQLIAREVGAGSGFLHPDVNVCSPRSSSPTPEYILLWRNSDKIPGSPFNLTPFAITLNDCPKDTLKPFLCPTDCRLRPDQRAFEMGKYEFANGLKNMQEELQRATRKAREEGKLPPHCPRWFTAETDGDTGERVWTPSRVGDVLEYWMEREKSWKRSGEGGWTRVDPIFIEEPDTLN